MRESLLGNMKKGLAFVISAPAGTGKTTLARMLAEEFSCVVQSISCTTRKPRTNEISNKDYVFLTKKEFEQKITAGDFLEHVELYGNYYGTCKQWVINQLDQGKHVILTIDTQGAKQLKNIFPAIFIFIQPPSIDVLRERLQGRQTETPEAIEERLLWAEKEIASANFYDYMIVNDNLSIAYQVLRSILIAKEHQVN